MEISTDDLAAKLALHIKYLATGPSEGERLNLRGVNLGSMNLSGADLRGADLSDTNLRYADLIGADLRGANLNIAGLSYADLTNADLDGADLSHAILFGADLSGADLTGANLTGADLSGTIMSGAVLVGANLTDAKMVDTGLYDATLFGANLSGLGVPIVPNLDAAILEAVGDDPSRLNMDTWHTCETTHCRAGWAITLAGPTGRDLERRFGSATAGALIYAASRPDKPVPNFFAPNAEALADMQESADSAVADMPLTF